MNGVVGIKGFDGNLRCQGKQYETGNTFEETEARLCNKGMHFAEEPLEVFRYYPPSSGRYCEVVGDAVSAEAKVGTSKRVC